MKRPSAIALLCLVALPAFAAGDYDKHTRNATYDIRLRVPAAAGCGAAEGGDLRRGKGLRRSHQLAVDDKKNVPQFFHPMRWTRSGA